MAANFNKVLLIGNLTRDPEVRYTPSGTAVADIGLAVNDRRKGSDGQWIEETTFVDVTLWARTAEVAGEYLTKGSNVLIEGRLKYDSWENNEGQKRSKLSVVCDRMQMLGGKGGGPGGGGRGDEAPRGRPVGRGGSDSGSRGGGGGDEGGFGPPDDDIPF